MVEDLLVDFARDYGWIFLLFYSFAESALLIPFSPETAILIGVVPVLVSDPSSYVFFVFVGTSSSVFGDLLIFRISRTYGRAGAESFVERFGGRRSWIDRLEGVLGGSGDQIIFWSRLVPVVRAYVPIFAGIGQMDLRRYLLLTVPGILLFHVVFIWMIWQGAANVSQISGVLVSRTSVFVILSTGIVLFVNLWGVYERYAANLRWYQ